MELKIDKVIETVLYVSDIERADAFIERCCNCRRWSPTNGFAPITSAIEAYCCCLLRAIRCAGALSDRVYSRARWRGAGAYRAGGSERPTAALGTASDGQRRGDRGADALGTRRREHLFSRSRRSSAGVGDAGHLGQLLIEPALRQHVQRGIQHLQRGLRLPLYLHSDDGAVDQHCQHR